MNSNKICLVFPGQGSQKVEMGKHLYDNHKIAREVFDEVDECLNFHLSKLIFNGPIEKLTQTENAQPALMAVSIAICRIIEYESGKKIDQIAYAICGHSLGEYSALCSVNSLSLFDTTKLLKQRGIAMQNAVDFNKAKMSAVLGLDILEIDKIIKNQNKKSICEVANDNCPGQVVLSGLKKDVDEVTTLCLKKGAKKIIDLNVSAPFHCSLMKKASEIMEKELKEVILEVPKINFLCNYNAQCIKDRNKIKEFLVKQVTARVRWRETLVNLHNLGVGKIVEIGAGKVLIGLSKRMKLNFENSSIETMIEIEQFIEGLIK